MYASAIVVPLHGPSLERYCALHVLRHRRDGMAMPMAKTLLIGFIMSAAIIATRSEAQAGAMNEPRQQSASESLPSHQSPVGVAPALR